MTLDEFKTKYLNQPVDFNHNGDIQCVDLVEQYNAEIVNAPRLWGNAADLIKNSQPNYYDLLTEHLWVIPPRGSIVVWNNNVGRGYGHCGIVLNATLTTFTSFDQNWLDIKTAKEVIHKYTNVAGYLVPKNTVQSLKYNQLVDDLTALVKKYPKV